MAYKVKYDTDSYEKGTEMSVVGLPPLPVGEWVTIDEDGEQYYEAQTGEKLTKDSFKDSGNITVEGSAKTEKGE